jgi:signal transduction histidine kinase
MEFSVLKFLRLGTRPTYSDIENRCISFSNVIYVAFPIVYIVFTIYDIEELIKPVHLIEWDQLILPLFILVCVLTLYLNIKGLSILGRIIFLVSWPLAFHIIPVIYQQTPDDYYLAYPLGIIMHSFMIQVIISRKEYPYLYFLLLIVNFTLILFFKEFLLFFDDDLTTSNPIVDNDYYRLDGLLYWLLFNLIIYYALEVMDSNFRRITQDRKKIQDQKNELENTVKRLEETRIQLIQSEKMAAIGSLASGVAHQLNNPLNVWAGEQNMIKAALKEIRSPNPDAELVKDLELMMINSEDSLASATRIVKGLVMSVDDSKEKQSIDISEIIDNAVSLVIPKNKTYELRLDLEVIRMDVYPNQMHQALSRVFENADYYCKDGGLVQISCISNQELCRIKCFNTGPAIPTSAINQIFDPFYTTKEQVEGTGLGLYIAFQIIQQHQGSIGFHNTMDGVEFEIILPISQED